MECRWASGGRGGGSNELLEARVCLVGGWIGRMLEKGEGGSVGGWVVYLPVTVGATVPRRHLTISSWLKMTGRYSSVVWGRWVGE